MKFAYLSGILMLSILVSACGGGGGSNGPAAINYTGKTTAATLTAANSAAISGSSTAAAVSGTNSSGTLAGIDTNVTPSSSDTRDAAAEVTKLIVANTVAQHSQVVAAGAVNV